MVRIHAAASAIGGLRGNRERGRLTRVHPPPRGAHSSPSIGRSGWIAAHWPGSARTIATPPLPFRRNQHAVGPASPSYRLQFKRKRFPSVRNSALSHEGHAIFSATPPPHPLRQSSRPPTIEPNPTVPRSPPRPTYKTRRWERSWCRATPKSSLNIARPHKLLARPSFEISSVGMAVFEGSRWPALIPI